MEQGVAENSVLLLKYKFYAFYDINPKVLALQFFFCAHIYNELN